MRWNTCISIHALLAESDHIVGGARNNAIRISIHALLAESDARNTSIAGRITSFLSTLSLRRATDVIAVITEAQSISIHALLAESDRNGQNIKRRHNISIHALLAESDASNQPERQEQHDFYPRSPCGERRTTASNRHNSRRFLSTLSLRRATPAGAWRGCGRIISIHALLAESDLCNFTPLEPPLTFLSTLSLRRAT